MKLTKEQDEKLRQIVEIYHQEMEKIKSDYQRDIDIAAKQIYKEIENRQAKKDEEFKENLLKELDEI